MDHEQLLTFITAAQLQNYSKTAVHLNLTQPAVTARIQKLEMELDCELFNRIGNKIYLTKEGESLVFFAEKILRYMDEAKQTIEQLKHPQLKIGLSPAFSVSTVIQVLSILQAKHNLGFDIVEKGDSIEIFETTAAGQVDIGLVRDLVPYPNLESSYICNDRLIFIVHKDHPLADKDTITKQDLVNQTMVCYRRHTPLWVKIDEQLVGIHNLNRIEVGSFEMVKSMVSGKWGFSIIPELALGYNDNNIPELDLQVIPFPEFDDMTFKVMGIYKKDSPNLGNLELFSRLLRAELTR